MNIKNFLLYLIFSAFVFVGLFNIFDLSDILTRPIVHPCGASEVSYVAMGGDEIELVTNILKNKGIKYVPPQLPPWMSSESTKVLGGTYTICADVRRDRDLAPILLSGERQVDVFTWRPLLFFRWPPWASYERVVETPWGPAVARMTYSLSTALLITLLLWIAGLYASWRLGNSRKIVFFVVPFALQVYSIAGFVLTILAIDITLSNYEAVVYHASPLLLTSAYPVAFYVGWRRARS